MKIKIPYTRFKAWHSGKYYDEDYFEYDLNSQEFKYMDEKQKSHFYYKMHTEILPEFCEKVGKDFYVVVLDDYYIGWPYLWIPKKVTYNE